MSLDERLLTAAEDAHRMVTSLPISRPATTNSQKLSEWRHGYFMGMAAAAVIVIAALILLRATTTSAPVAAPGTTSATSTTTMASGLPVADYVIDLNTGQMTPLPAAILNSLGPKRPRDLPSPGQYAASPDGSLLAYVGTGNDGSLQIFIAGIDGTGVRQVTHHPTDAISPDWSPDGAMIAYQVSGGLFVLDVATGESTQVPDLLTRVSHNDGSPVAFGPQFTPDGSSLLYTGPGDDYLFLWIVPIEGGSSTVLIGREQGMGHASDGSMSPDGSLVTMLGHKIYGPGAGRFLADTDGSVPRNLGQLHSGNCWSNPAGTWSPDGSRIVCSGDDGVLVVDVATGESSRVAEGTAASWLDDHTLIVEG